MGIINFFKKTYEKIGIAYLWEGVYIYIYIYIYILMFYNNFNKKKSFIITEMFARIIIIIIIKNVRF